MNKFDAFVLDIRRSRCVRRYVNTGIDYPARLVGKRRESEGKNTGREFRVGDDDVRLTYILVSYDITSVRKD